MIILNYSLSAVCRSRDDADWAQYHRGTASRRKDQTRRLMDSLRRSDISWGLGESMRRMRMGEINALTDEEKRQANNLRHTEVIPVVSVPGSKPTLVGTLRIRPEYLTRPVFKMPVYEPPSVASAPTISIDPGPDAALTFARREVSFGVYLWEVEASLVELARVFEFEFVDGLYMDDKNNYVHIQGGVRYLAGSGGSLVTSCRRCGVEHLVPALEWFKGWLVPDMERCPACKRENMLEPVRMDDLDERWLPFWKLVDGPY